LSDRRVTQGRVQEWQSAGPMGTTADQSQDRMAHPSNGI
jgi:hypothetical protein